MGYHHRHKCVGCLAPTNEESKSDLLDYVESRKQIYVPIYCELVKQAKDFQKLKQHLAAGKNLLIIEVDGPKEESMPYYKQKYGVPNDWISHGTIEANVENQRHAFGHGYCLAAALLGMEEELLKPEDCRNGFSQVL